MRAPVRLIALAALAVMAPSAALAATPAQRIGPSFACPAADDPLAHLICEDADLSQLDLSFVQTYQAYRQSLPADAQKALGSEALEFGRTMRAACGIAAAKLAAPAAPAGAAGCVAQAYMRQRAVWAGRLTGAAAEEAGRPLTQHLARQRDMQTLGLLAGDQDIDGVFTGTVRNAIIAFQITMGLPVTGLLGAAEASRLEQEVAARHAAPTNRIPASRPAAAPAGHALWEHFRSEALAAGIRAAASVSEDVCAVQLDIQQPDSLARMVGARSREAGAAAAETDETHLFRAALLFLQTELAAKAVRALYGDQPRADRCSFTAAAYTADIYGRDVRQPLFGFSFDRATYERIVWDRFDTANLPKIMLSFSYGEYAQARLRGLAGSPPAGSPAPVVPPAAPSPAAPARIERAGLPATASADAPDGRALERGFVALLDAAAQAFETAGNDLAKGAARGRRARQLCELLHGADVAGWVGEAETLATTADGKGALVIRIAPHVTIGTANNNFADGLAPIRTLITDPSPVLDAAIALRPQQRVVFAGRFARSDTDCVFEQSPTLAGAMRDPAFLFQFSSIRPEE